jgi:hypothetical protein
MTEAVRVGLWLLKEQSARYAQGKHAAIAIIIDI